MKAYSSVAAGALLALSGAPLFAQEACGGIGTNGQWVGGNEAASDISTATSYKEQMALVLGGNQYVSLFTVSAPTDIRIEAQGRGSGDPTIDLYDSTGTLVTSDDDSGGNGAARAELAVDAGSYCVVLRSFDAAAMTGFVRIGRTEHEPLTTGVSDPMPEPDEPDVSDTFADMSAPFQGDCTATTFASPMTFGTPATGSASDSPFWRFSLSEATPIVITATNSEADPYIMLYDNEGMWLGENDDWDGLDSRLEIMETLQPGDYCIAVSALSNGSLPITLLAEKFDAEEAQRRMYDRAEDVPPLDGSYPVTSLGTLSTSLRADLQASTTATWYSIDMVEGGVLLAEAYAKGGMGDSYLTLFDELGREVAYNDDTNGTDPMIVARVHAGTYLLAVLEYSDTPVQTRVLLERYVPAQ